MGEKYVIGCDVGTGSVRAGLVSISDGRLVVSYSQSIKLFEQVVGHHVHLEQSANDIWNSCCSVISKCLENIEASQVVSIAFDATCSLVVTSKSGKKLSVSVSGDTERDVILWACHRATPQAARINASKYCICYCMYGCI
jgi:D-ribulokinase